MNGHSESVNSVAISSDNKYIVSGSGDKTIKIWNLESGQEIKTLNGHSSATEVTSLLWPVNVLISYPLSRFHILMVLSPLPETMNLLSELIATEFTLLLWPCQCLNFLSTF